MPDDSLYRRDLLRLAGDANGAGRLPAPDATATLSNPACGDRVTVDVMLSEGRITALAHDTRACILAQASAALLVAEATGLTRVGLSRLADGIREMLQGGPLPSPGYAAFEGVAGHAGRQACVLLPVHTALKALESAEEGCARA